MALWDGRFSSRQDENLKKFTESISFDKRLYRYDIRGSKAHVAMLAESGIITKKTAQRISARLDEIEARIGAGTMKLSTDLEDIHMNIENELIRLLGDDGARVHTARSRNDQIALDIRLYLRDVCDQIKSEIRGLQHAIVAKADEHPMAIMPGFTHLQHAQPICFAHHLLAYAEMFERDIGRLDDCRKRLNVMPLGSGAIAGTTLPINRRRTAMLLDFPEISRNSIDAVSDRDFICEFLACLSVFAMHVSRLSEDIILWCSQEFGFAELDDAFSTGSSLMPQKKNPDIAELARGKTGRIYGSLISILTVCKGLPLAYNRDLQEDKEPLFDAIDTVRKLLSVYPGMIATLKIRTDRMAAAASNPELMATDLAELLVWKGVPFRTAHSSVGRLVKWCHQKGKRLDGLTLEEMQSVIPAADKVCLNIFKPNYSIGKRGIYGGTGFREVRRQINLWKSRLKRQKTIGLLSGKCT